MIRIAITGNIASGKSQAEKILKDLGYIVYDSDKIAHEVLNNIKDFYGLDVFTNGIIDRKKLGKIVFSNPDIKKKLEDLVHPAVKSEILNLFEVNKNNKYVFVSVPLLYEAHFDNLFDKIILITVEPNTQLKRLIERNNFSEAEAIARISSQIPQDIKKQKADFIIDNNSTVDYLKAEMIKIISQLESY